MHLVRRSSARTTLTLPNVALLTLTLTSDAATDIRHRMRSCQAAAAPRLLVFGVPLMPQIAVAPLPPLPLLLSLPCAVRALRLYSTVLSSYDREHRAVAWLHTTAYAAELVLGCYLSQMRWVSGWRS